MISTMETQLGMMVVGPTGECLRIERSHPAFHAGKDAIRKTIPGEQIWLELKALMADPLRPLALWCERFGLKFSQDGDTFNLNDIKLSKLKWIPLLQRLQATSGTPAVALNLASMLRSYSADTQAVLVQEASVGNACLHLDTRGGLNVVNLVRKVMLPADAKPGDIVLPSATGPSPFLVSYSDFHATSTGDLVGVKGSVLRSAEDLLQTADILAQPVILGADNTYRCEEGNAAGWFEDLSFDSLEAAQINLKAIRSTGAEARIINRVTNLPVET